MAKRKRALVIGGSVGGLFAASLLRETGWEATVFERSRQDLAGRGAGVGVTQELLDVMERIGTRFDPTIGVPTRGRIWLDRTGEIRFEQRRETVGSAWGRIYRPLRDAYPDAHYRTGMALAWVEQTGDEVIAVFEDGSRVTGDLLVAADGTLSTVRGQFMPEVAPVFAGYVAWRSLVEPDAVPRATLDRLSGRIVFSFNGNDMMLTMMVPGVGEGPDGERRRIYFIWYRPTGSEAALRDLFTDAAGRDHGVSIPPPLIRPELVADIKATAGELFAPEVTAVVRAAPQPLLQAISDMEAPRLVVGRVALLGDAAFVARPHVAGGITKAAIDAVRLADALAEAGDDVAAGLAAYDAAQLDFGRRLVAHGRRLGSYVEAPESGEERLDDPVSVMLEYGAPHLLHDADVTPFRAATGGGDGAAAAQGI